MAEDQEKLAESAWRDAFRERLRTIQGRRTQDDMAELLGISRDTWNKCVNRGDTFPIRKLPRLAKLAQLSIEELINGEAARSATTGTQRKAAASHRRSSG